MGFCLTNHVAVAARWAVDGGHASRVLVIDWDAHHGNGTEDIFWTDPSVLYVSLHQYPWYPGTGDATDVGDGPGRGYTLNIPLPAASAEDAYDRAFTDLIEPAAQAFRPELVLVSAGFDAHAADPLCMMRLTAGAFFRMTQRIVPMGAGPVCILEGGYDLDALAWGSSAMAAALLGDDRPAGVPTSELGTLPGDPGAHDWIERCLELRRRLELQL
jgi:acetoin utilization deacetylase AcuC-like enzyme